jgi:hypothetical protein
MNRKMIISSLIIFFICFHIYIAVKYAVISFNGTISEPDVSAFYYAANVVLDRNISNTAAYNLDIMYKISPDYGINQNPMPFVYSLASAYIMSPITLIPYKEAKIVWSFLSLLMYIGALTIFLYIGRVSKVWFMGTLALLLAWLPFAYSQVWLQSNALLIFLVSLAVLAAVKDRPFTSGILIGIASLFKLFPLALAVYLGIKNWRICAACASTFIASFLIPGSLDWFSAIKNIHINGISKININPPVNFWLNQLGSIWFVIFAAIIAGVTAIIIYRSRAANYPALFSLAIPSAFLVSPLVDYHHLTMLALSYAYIFTKVESFPRLLLVSIIISFLLINVGFGLTNINPIGLLVIMGLMLLWLSLVLWLRHFYFTSKHIH